MFPGRIQELPEIEPIVITTVLIGVETGSYYCHLVSVDPEEDEEPFHFGADGRRRKRRPETEEVVEHAHRPESRDLQIRQSQIGRNFLIF